jgi:hypothetical protein
LVVGYDEVGGGGVRPGVPPAGRTWLAVERGAVLAVAAPDVLGGA